MTCFRLIEEKGNITVLIVQIMLQRIIVLMFILMNYYFKVDEQNFECEEEKKHCDQWIVILFSVVVLLYDSQFVFI